MRFKLLPLLLVFICPFVAEAQKDIKKECVPTTMFSATYSYQFPGADTKILYCNNSTVGASVLYKTDKNWMWTANANFIFGDKIRASREDILGIILDNSGELVTGDGIWASYAMFERGFHLQGKFGKIFNVCAPNPNCGFFVSGGLGYLMNRIRIEFSSYASPPANLDGDYRYGYDRMRGGLAYSGEIGYMYMSNSRVLNFSVSLEFTQAHTKPLRQWDFNLMGPDLKTYLDRYYGIRLSVYIPTYKRMPAEYYYF
jgi:hypothetical protein